MSVPVELSELAEKIDAFGDLAYLVTVGEDAPHAVSVVVTWDDDALTVGAGRRTAANAEVRPQVTLLWPAPAAQPYCLIVDGTAEPAGETLAIHPTRAVLHRVAHADPSIPSCVTVLER